MYQNDEDSNLLFYCYLVFGANYLIQLWFLVKNIVLGHFDWNLCFDFLFTGKHWIKPGSKNKSSSFSCGYGGNFLLCKSRSGNKQCYRRISTRSTSSTSIRFCFLLSILSNDNYKRRIISSHSTSRCYIFRAE